MFFCIVSILNICHINSLFVPNHGPRVFVGGEVDMVSGVGYKPERWGPGMKRDYVDLRLIVTDLCVLACDKGRGGLTLVERAPGISVEDVIAATGAPVRISADA